ncbi:unnamed protein product [Arctia plantaginis]|uniref:DDE-1 domain-containing protein n=1 Tax=Arctia plantaginis TaxID=874455 RepID=A0A8S1BES2_ARCPL|nr:unnamed protein product [Arctia plantaginis]
MPGPDFMSCFLKRHKYQISKRLSQNIKRSRAAISPDTIKAYFEELQNSLEGIPPINIVNYDETNLSDDPGRKRVLVKRSVKYPERIMNHTKGSISLMIAAAADGSLLPPYVVYKAQNMYDTWRQNGPKNCRYSCTPSGWFDGNTFQDWVRTIAMPYFSDKSGAKILIGDNLASHLSIDLIKECQENDIKFVFLPANSTHLTQPLDVAFFRPLKMAWRNLLLDWKKTDGRTQASLPKNIFPSLLKKLMNNIECNVAKNILAGFDKCGRSVENVQDENINENLQTATDNDCKAGPSNFFAIGRMEKHDIKQQGTKRTALVNEKTDRGVKTTNKSLIKKTKTKEQKNETKPKKHDKEAEVEANILKKNNKNPVILEKQNPIICCNNLSTFAENASQQNISPVNFENQQLLENVENMDIINVDLDAMPVIFEDFLTIPNEVEVVTSENTVACHEFKDKTKINMPEKKNKIHIISDEVVNFKPKFNICKLKKEKNIKRPQHYRNDAEILSDLMDNL